MSTTPLRVMTYNIHAGIGMDNQPDLNRIAGVIRLAKVDLVALQEVDRYTTRSGPVDQAARLGTLTGMQAVFGKAGDDAGGECGVAILSKYPLGEVTRIQLPHRDDREPRIALAARIRLNDAGDEIIFICTHLDDRDDDVDRLPQAQAINTRIGADPQTPLILAGDLNDKPTGVVLGKLTTQWLDATAGQNATFPADRPHRKLDYILVRPAGRWRVIDADVIADRQSSDHRPVIATLHPLTP